MAADRPVAVITGASAGVGRAPVRAFARSGFDVALLTRAGGWRQRAREVEQAGGRALVVATDVAQWGKVDAACETFVEALRRR